MTFFKRLFSKPKLEVIQKSSTTLRLGEWCSEKTLVSTGGRLWANPDFQMAIQVLENEHPAWMVLNPNVRPDQRIAHQAKCEGYTMALANLKALKIHNKPQEWTEPTFAPENAIETL